MMNQRALIRRIEPKPRWATAMTLANSATSPITARTRSRSIIAWTAVMAIIGVTCMLVLACRNDTPLVAPDEDDGPGAPYFEDVTAASGIDMTYRNGEEAGHYAILESLG